MKTILSALLALSALAGVAASAYAFDARTFYEDQDRQKNQALLTGDTKTGPHVNRGPCTAVG